MSAGRILVVDDEADIRGLLKEILSEEGYEVEVARTRAEATARLEERARCRAAGKPQPRDPVNSAPRRQGTCPGAPIHPEGTTTPSIAMAPAWPALLPPNPCTAGSSPRRTGRTAGTRNREAVGRGVSRFQGLRVATAPDFLDEPHRILRTQRHPFGARSPSTNQSAQAHSAMSCGAPAFAKSTKRESGISIPTRNADAGRKRSTLELFSLMT